MNPKLIILLLPALLFAVGCSTPTSKHAKPSTESKKVGQQLVRLITVEAAERENLVLDQRLGPIPVVFGWQNSEWRMFKSKIQSGDELWVWSASIPDGLQQQVLHYPMAGLCIRRSGKLVASITTNGH